MPGIIQRPTREENSEKADLHHVLLRLNDDDRDKLLHLCQLGKTNKTDILRQCLRFVYQAEMAELRGKGAA